MDLSTIRWRPGGSLLGPSANAHAAAQIDHDFEFDAPKYLNFEDEMKKLSIQYNEEWNNQEGIEEYVERHKQL